MRQCAGELAREIVTELRQGTALRSSERQLRALEPYGRNARSLREGHPLTVLVVRRQAFRGQCEQQRFAGIEIEREAGHFRSRPAVFTSPLILAVCSARNLSSSPRFN